MALQNAFLTQRKPSLQLSEFSLDDLQLLVDENPYLRGYLQGYLGELQLRRKLQSLRGVEGLGKIPDTDDLRGDLKVQYLGVPLTVEVKSLGSNTARFDPLSESWESVVLCKNTDSRTIYVEGLGEVKSVNLTKGEFDILAICTYPVTGTWDYLYIENRFLPEPDNKPGFIKSKFTINVSTTPGLHADPEKVFTQARLQKIRS